MDKSSHNYKWKKVSTRKHTSPNPIPRWGHTSCVIKDQLAIFGGYADSHYMNDLWIYNATTCEWKEIATTGEAPQNRSNCTMNYDSLNNRIVIFGGGGSSKARFNTIHVLDWPTKHWTLIKPADQKRVPWERTYHSAELYFPYLVVFGGEGITDLDDLWIFDFNNLTWNEVKMDKKKPMPCARRFHSSAMVGREMFIIAGCHSRYRSINDMFSLDLTPLIEDGNYEALEWKERRLEGATFLTMWGHTSSVLQDKIYVFGGRFHNDLNDLIAIDLTQNTIRVIKCAQDLPIARRRHCASFIGSCLVVFGGFNGEYFNDMHYINLQSKPQVTKLQILSKYAEMTKQNQEITSSQTPVQSKPEETTKVPMVEHNPVSLPFGFAGPYKKGKEFVISKDNYAKTPLTSVSTKTPAPGTRGDSAQTKAKAYYNMVQDRLKGNEFESSIFSIPNQSSGTIKFRDENWLPALTQDKQLNAYYDLTVVSGAHSIKTSKTIISLMSKYISSLINSDDFGDSGPTSERVQIQAMPERVFIVFVRYLQYDLALVPQSFSEDEWASLAAAAKYYCLERLASICEVQLGNTLNSNNLNKIFYFAVNNGLTRLTLHCAELSVRKQTNVLRPVLDQGNCKNIIENYQKLSYNHYAASSLKPAASDPIQKEMDRLKQKAFKLMYLDVQQTRQECIERAARPKDKSLRRVDSEKENSEINS